jgi:hypothetical protein
MARRLLPKPIARVVDIGSGLRLRADGRLRAARGTYVIMGDCGGYDFAMLEPFLEKIRQGYQFVMSTRLEGGILPGAMPALHRYPGNPVRSTLGRMYVRATCGDFHCGRRAANTSGNRR